MDNNKNPKKSDSKIVSFFKKFIDGKNKSNVVLALLAIYDAFAITLAYFLALYIRFDGNYTEIPSNFLMAWLKFAPIYVVICLVTFIILHLYRSLWRFASYKELTMVILSSVQIYTIITHCCIHIVYLLLFYCGITFNSIT